MTKHASSFFSRSKLQEFLISNGDQGKATCSLIFYKLILMVT
jgi:hypothetical protein